MAKREADLLRDEMERMRNELRNFDLEVRRELDLMAETRAAPGLPDPRASPALQRRRTEDVKPTIRQQSAPAAVCACPHSTHLWPHTDTKTWCAANGCCTESPAQSWTRTRSV